MTYQPDSSGINSLSGFSFQIKVFVYYMLMLEEGMQIEFETLEDVNIKNIENGKIDQKSENFISKLLTINSNIAIQVKRTGITNAVAQQVLLNWILLESSENNISEYLLFTDSEYDNKDIIFKKSATELFDIIVDSDKQKNATISKVKKLYKDNYTDFEKIYEEIKRKYTFKSIGCIDKQIDDGCSVHFRKLANKVVYNQRLKELLQHITVQIMEAVDKRRPYVIGYEEFIKLIEDISCRLTEEITAPLYSNFKKIHTVDLSSIKISESREYKQLVACELPNMLIKQHLLFGMYYENTKFKYMETNKISRIREIEETTYENYENVKFRLQKNKEDEPYNRLEETKKMPNSYAENEQIRYGAGIYLTRENIDKNQISWEDEQNAKLAK